MLSLEKKKNSLDTHTNMWFHVVNIFDAICTPGDNSYYTAKSNKIFIFADLS